MGDLLSAFNFRLGVSLLVVCVICGCEQKEPKPQKETPQSQPKESADVPSTPDESAPKEASEEKQPGGGDSSQNETKPASASEPASGAPGTPAESNPAKGSPSGSGAATSSGASTPRGKALKFASPEQAKAFGQSQLERAEKAAKAGKVADAYEATLAGWAALQPHCGDGSCKTLSDQLLARMEQYGEQMPSSNAEPLIGKPLKIR